jgi:hypothetical protein
MYIHKYSYLNELGNRKRDMVANRYISSGDERNEPEGLISAYSQ